MSRTLREAAQMALNALLIGYHRGTQDAITALREALAAPPAAPAPAVPASGWVWAHRKGGEYTVFGKGKIQCDAHLDDMADVVIYRSSKDGTLWARPEAEFNERFNRLRPLAAPPAAPAPAAPVVPLTDAQILSMWKSSEFRGNGGQADWFCEGIRAAEAHHGITGGKP